MFLKKKTHQHRRDFSAIYACEHCENEIEDRGYDDYYFHDTVIPQMKCKKCGKTADPGSPTSVPDVPAHVVL